MTSNRLKLASEPDSDFGSESDSEVGSNERTNERTNGETDTDRIIPSVARRARAYDDAAEFLTIGDVLAETLGSHSATLGKRHPLIRTGERDEIPLYVRSAVMYRDRFLCERCPDKKPSGPLHLDHITPWSAGGADTTDNLRLLCERHNIERSNFIDLDRQRRPATWWCINCYSREGFAWDYPAPGVVVCPMHPYYGCRVVRGYERLLKAGEPATWHDRDPVIHADTLAYCAHCDAPGLTDKPL